MPNLYDERTNKEPFNGVNAGSPSTIRIPADRGMVHQANAYYTENGSAATKAVMLAAIPEFELLINGDTFSKYKTEDVLMLDEFYGETFVAGELPMRFAQEARRTIQEVEATSFIPSAHTDPQMRYHIASGRVLPTLEQTLVTEGVGPANRQAIAAQPARGANQIIKHYRKTVDILTSGDGNPNDYRYEGGGRLLRGLHFKGSNITSIKVFVNEQERWHFRDLAHLNARLASKGMVPQADVWHIAFEALSGGIGGSFDPNLGGKNTLDFEITTSDTTDVELLAEIYNRPASKL